MKHLDISVGFWRCVCWVPRYCYNTERATMNSGVTVHDCAFGISLVTSYSVFEEPASSERCIVLFSSVKYKHWPF